MKRHLSVFVIITCLCIFACTKKEQGEILEGDTAVAGVTFEKLSLEDALTKAKAENKLVTIDFFAPT